MIYNFSLNQVDLAWEMGHRRKAKDASINARYYAVRGIVVGVMILILYIVLVAFTATGRFPIEITSARSD